MIGASPQGRTAQDRPLSFQAFRRNRRPASANLLATSGVC